RERWRSRSWNRRRSTRSRSTRTGRRTPRCSASRRRATFAPRCCNFCARMQASRSTTACSSSRRRSRPACSAVTDILPKWNEPAIRVLMMPRDTNAHGTIFGGVILSYIDQAGAIEARRQGLQFMVTVSMDRVVFHEPVYVGDLVSFWTETLRIGTTSITTKVTVEAIRTGNPNKRVTVTEAQVVYVNLGEDRKPKPIG